MCNNVRKELNLRPLRIWDYYYQLFNCFAGDNYTTDSLSAVIALSAEDYGIEIVNNESAKALVIAMNAIARDQSWTRVRPLFAASVTALQLMHSSFQRIDDNRGK